MMTNDDKRKHIFTAQQPLSFCSTTSYDKNTHTDTTIDIARRLCLTGGMFTAIIDKAEGGKQRSNAPENS